MRIIIEDTYFRVAPDDDELSLVRVIVSSIARFKERGWQYKKREMLDKYKKDKDSRQYKYWNDYDGYKDLFYMSAGDFNIPNGLLKPFLRTSLLFGLKYDLVDLRPEPYVLENKISYDRFPLYEFQQDIVKQIKENDGLGLISAPTGSGKTFIGTELIAEYSVPTIIIADKLKIIKQWIDTLVNKRKGNLTFKKHGSVNVGYANGEPAILICTGIMLRKFYERRTQLHKDAEQIINRCSLLIYDEVHNAGSKTAQILLDNCMARYRIGMSGTVLKRTAGNDMEYTARIGQVVSHIDTDTVLELGKIVPIDVFFKAVRRVGINRMKYDDAREKLITYNYDRNSKIVEEVMEFLEKDMKFIIFVDRINHAQELHRLTGIDWTDSKDKEGEQKFKDLEDGVINGLICTYQLVGEGFDLPSLDALILAGAGKSAIKIIQAKGRVLRCFDGKEKGLIIDFADSSKYFDEHALERYKIYQAEAGVTLHTKGTWLHGK